MRKIVRMTSETPISPESIERLKRLAEMPDEFINTVDIPERHFDVARAVQRRKAGWTAVQPYPKKAS